MRKKNSLLRAALMIVAATGLAACGGGGEVWIVGQGAAIGCFGLIRASQREQGIAASELRLGQVGSQQ